LSKIPVALLRVKSYDIKLLAPSVKKLLDTVGIGPAYGTNVLVKPNLLTPKDHLSTTHPLIVRAVCEYLIDHGARVRVGDSPAFGTARKVAEKNGLLNALKGLNVPVINLGRPRKVELPSGISLGISRDVIESDLILNLPKLKAHCQMGMTLSVKNMFGSVVGFRKAMAHVKWGDVSNKFQSMILEILEIVPETISLLDGIVAMHRTGPSGALPYELGLMGASKDGVALDTAIYSLLALNSEEIPLWKEAQERRMPGAFLANLAFPLLKPDDFNSSHFETPLTLKPVTFHPLRMLKGRIKSVIVRFS